MRSIPTPPLVLGVAGLLPFWALALAVAMHVRLPIAADVALAAYGAVIISFLGGIRWGVAVARTGAAADYAVSVVPSLAAWALLAAPEPWRLAGLGVLALLLGPVDLSLVLAGDAPHWFGRLRLILSAGAGSALLLAAAGTR